MSVIILPPKTVTRTAHEQILRSSLAKALKRKGPRGEWAKYYGDTIGAPTDRGAAIIRKAFRMGRFWDVALGNTEIVERIGRTIAETAEERKERLLSLYAERFANGLTIFEGEPLPDYMQNVSADILTDDEQSDTI